MYKVGSFLLVLQRHPRMIGSCEVARSGESWVCNDMGGQFRVIATISDKKSAEFLAALDHLCSRREVNMSGQVCDPTPCWIHIPSATCVAVMTVTLPRIPLAQHRATQQSRLTLLNTLSKSEPIFVLGAESSNAVLPEGLPNFSVLTSNMTVPRPGEFPEILPNQPMSLAKLPVDVLETIVSNIHDSVSLANLGGSCRIFRELTRLKVPHLRLKLFPHQLDSLDRMLQMETPSPNVPDPTYQICSSVQKLPTVTPSISRKSTVEVPWSRSCDFIDPADVIPLSPSSDISDSPRDSRSFESTTSDGDEFVTPKKRRRINDPNDLETDGDVRFIEATPNSAMPVDTDGGILLLPIELQKSNASTGLWYSDLTSELCHVPPKVPKVLGGLLCDPPGLGKTITCLALILKTLIRPRDRLFNCCRDALTSVPTVDRVVSNRMRDRYRRRNLLHSHATLIAVPTVLLDHWQHQITTHTDPAAELRILRINGDVPSPVTLVAYDIVLVGIERFSLEWKRAPLVSFDRRRKSRDAADDQEPASPSPFLQVMWRRVIVDEGHALKRQSLTTLWGSLAVHLECQARWVVTGTPTLKNDTLYHLLTPLTFLRLKPHTDDKGNFWNRRICQPLTRGASLVETDCAKERLQIVLDNLMIHHSSSEVKLPQTTVHDVELRFPSAQAATSYNDLVLLVRRNLCVTRYMDQPFRDAFKDSILHSKARAMANEALRNVRKACCVLGHVGLAYESSDGKDVVTSTTDMLKVTHAPAEKIEYIDQVVRSGVVNLDVDDQRSTFKCSAPGCECSMSFPFLGPCGDVLCEDHVNQSLSGSRCITCNLHFDINDFQRLQPQLTQKYWRGISLWLDNPGPKTAFILKVLQEHPEMSKVIIYSQFVEHLGSVAHHLQEKNIPFVSFVRDEIPVSRFKDENSGIRVILLSDEGAYGLDLSIASGLFILEPIWDEGKQDQIIRRAHRIGRKGALNVYKLYMKGTIEEGIYQRLDKVSTEFGYHLNGSLLQKDKSLSDELKVRDYLLGVSFCRTFDGS